MTFRDADQARANVDAPARGVAAAMALASALGLEASEAVVVHASNRLAVRLLPCDVLARVSAGWREGAQFEVDIAVLLMEAGAPVARLDPRVVPRAYERDGFTVTFWTYHDPLPSLEPATYAAALRQLHLAMRGISVSVPHVLDRVREAQDLIANDAGPAQLDAGDRALLATTLARAARGLQKSGAPEQVLHGEPHPGNVLSTAAGPRFIDLETCCRGPVEFDIAHAPPVVGELSPDIDRRLLEQCRVLVLAMAAAWRLDPADEFPNGAQVLQELVALLRKGPPFPPLSVIAGLH